MAEQQADVDSDNCHEDLPDLVNEDGTKNDENNLDDNNESLIDMQRLLA